MKYAKLLSIILGLMILTACVQMQKKEITYKTFKETNLGLTLEYPSTWERTKVEGDMVFTDPANSKTQMRIKLLKTKASGGTYETIAEVVAAYKITVEDLHAEEIKDKETTLDGLAAHEYKIQYEDQGRTYIRKVLTTKFNGYFMMMTFESLEEDAGELTLVFDKIEGSVDLPTEISGGATDVGGGVFGEGEEIADQEDGEPRCGDDVCEGDENCNNCSDCTCGSGKTCNVDGECVDVECRKDSDCNDDNACTQDVCQFAGNPNAYCSASIIKTCKDNDGCCPSSCNAENDDDCEPECGNDVCEDGEDADDCPEDCTVFSSGTTNLDIYESTNEYVFSFDEGEVEEKDNANGDKTLRYFDDNDVPYLGSPTGDNVIQDDGECDSLDDLEYAPSSGYEEEVEVIDGHCYYIETPDGNYGKIRIKNIDIGDDVRFDWVFRSDGERDLEE